MGRLENGQWIVEDVIPKSKDGEFRRQEQSFRNQIVPGTEFEPEADRYHLYVSYACPWANRTLIFLKLKKLESLISVSVCSPIMLDDGWTFRSDFRGVIADSVLKKEFLRDIYLTADPHFSGKVTVPVLFDKKTNRIVNNESAEILRIFNRAFNELTGDQSDFYPEALKSEIDAINDGVYNHVNNGVYKAGFAKNQAVYEKHVTQLFKTLDELDERLRNRRYLVGEQLTEADVRLFTTLARFDCVYHGHFKCNLRMIRDYKNLSRYLADLFSRDEFASTTQFDHIKQHYYFSHTAINPTQVVPVGPKEPIAGVAGARAVTTLNEPASRADGGLRP